MITRMLVILYIVVVMWWPLALECSLLICAFYLCCRHGTYVVVTCPRLSNVTRWMQINTNTSALEGTSALSD